MKPVPYPIDLLSYSNHLQITMDGDLKLVFDPIRKQRMKLTPEEFVRQLLLQYFNHKLNVGLGRIRIEKQIKNYQSNRFDLSILNHEGRTCLLIECKSFSVPINQEAFIQISKYNTNVGSPLLMLTNGKEAYLWRTGLPIQWITKESDLSEAIKP